jgi:hypothetical protein
MAAPAAVTGDSPPAVADFAVRGWCERYVKQPSVQNKDSMG